jgi:hypothetical protein
MRSLLSSLRRLILGETWTIPVGVAGTIGLALALRSWLPETTWKAVGGFCLATFVLVALAYSLRRAPRGRQ